MKDQFAEWLATIEGKDRSAIITKDDIPFVLHVYVGHLEQSWMLVRALPHVSMDLGFLFLKPELYGVTGPCWLRREALVSAVKLLHNNNNKEAELFAPYVDEPSELMYIAALGKLFIEAVQEAEVKFSDYCAMDTNFLEQLAKGEISSLAAMDNAFKFTIINQYGTGLVAMLTADEEVQNEY